MDSKLPFDRLFKPMRSPRHAALALLLIWGTASPALPDDTIAEQAVKLLMPYSVLSGNATGTTILNESQTTTIAIQNGQLPNGQYMTAEQLTARRAQASIDANTTNDWNLAPTTANALGSAFEQTYWNAITASATTTLTTGNVYKLFNQATSSATSTSTQELSSISKDYFSGQSNPASSVPFASYGGVAGQINVYLYYAPPGTTYENYNPRPLQLWPYTSGTLPNIQQFSAPTFVAPAPGIAASTNGTPEENYTSSDIDGSGLGASYPSGHTTFGTTSTILYAMMAPELYQNAMLRQSEFGESRIYMGFHHTLDVIGGRIVGTYGTVAWLRNQENWQLYQNATADFRNLLINGNAEQFQETIAATSAWSEATLEQNGADFDYRMTYGLDGLDSSAFGPSGESLGAMPYTYAAILLTSRYPYFVPESFDPTNAAPDLGLPEIAAILTSTLNDQTGPLDNPLYNGAYANWSKINLFAAAGGYGQLTSDVTVSMDASKGPTEANPGGNSLWVNDTWSNTISGNYTLTKTEIANEDYGPTRLTLSGNNTFAGVKALGGELVLTGNNTFFSDSSVGNGGNLIVANGGLLHAAGDVTVESGGVLAVVFEGNDVVQAGITNGGFTNHGTVILYADPSVNGGAILRPISSPSALAGSGSYSVLGGQWNEASGNVTVSQISQGNVSGDTGTFQNFVLDGQRVGFAFGGGGENDVMVSLLDDSGSTTYNLTVVDLEIREALQSIGGQPVLAAFEFSTTLDADSVFLSFNVGENLDAGGLLLWTMAPDSLSWSLFDPAVFNYNGDYFSFAPEVFGSYAVTAVPEPRFLGLLALAFLAVCLRRRA